MAKKSQNYANFTYMSLVKRARSVVVKCHRKNERTLTYLGIKHEANENLLHVEKVGNTASSG